MRPSRDDEDPEDQVDLHGLRPENALRRLAQALHACRVRHRETLLVITGAGHGNPTQEPVLRARVEAWLVGPEGLRAGARSFTRESRGGALRVRLGALHGRRA